jgi:hypothetical protein
MQRLWQRIDRWLFEEYRTDAVSLGFFRIFFGCYLVLRTLPLGYWIRELPPTAFCPPVSFAAFFQHYPPHWIIVALNAATALCACTLLLGFRTVFSSIGVAVGLVSIESFCYADGKIDHRILEVITPLALAFSGWGSALSIDAKRSSGEAGRFSRNHAVSLAILAMLIGFALFTAGFAKIRGGWLSPNVLATRWQLLPNYYLVGRKVGAAFWALENLPPWLWKGMDWFTVIWEAGFVLTVMRRGWCRLACAFGALFHFGAWQLFDIEFDVNEMAYSALVSWAFVSEGATERVVGFARGLSTRARIALCAAPFLTAALSVFLLGSPPNDALSLHLGPILLTLGLLMALGFVFRQVQISVMKLVIK